MPIRWKSKAAIDAFWELLMTLWAPGSRTAFELAHQWSPLLEAKCCFWRIQRTKGPGPGYSVSFPPGTLGASRVSWTGGSHLPTSEAPRQACALTCGSGPSPGVSDLVLLKWDRGSAMCPKFPGSAYVPGWGPHFESPWSKSWPYIPGLRESPALSSLCWRFWMPLCLWLSCQEH